MICSFTIVSSQASQERFIDVADVLRDVPDNHVFEDDSDEEEAIWDHEARFARTADGDFCLQILYLPYFETCKAIQLIHSILCH